MKQVDADTAGNGSLDADRQIDMGVDMDMANIDAIANEIRSGCRCRNENLKVELVWIRNSADRAIYIVDKCYCTDNNASTLQSIE